MPRERRTVGRFRVTAIAAILIIVVSIGAISIGALLYYRYPQETTIQQLLANPQIYNGRTVKVYGLVVKNIGSFWGEQYDLYADYPTPFNPNVRGTFVALAVKPSEIESYVAYTWDGGRFQRSTSALANPIVVIEGIFHDQGRVPDAPQFYIEVHTIQYSMATISGQLLLVDEN